MNKKKPKYKIGDVVITCAFEDSNDNPDTPQQAVITSAYFDIYNKEWHYYLNFHTHDEKESDWCYESEIKIKL